MTGDLNHSDIYQHKLESDEFHHIKPQEGMTIETARRFWDNLFSKEITSYNEPQNNYESTKSAQSEEDCEGRRGQEGNRNNAGETNKRDETADQDSFEGEKNNDEIKELTQEEINEMQRKAIKEAFERIARGEKLTDAEKGNLGEMLMDQYYIGMGYTPIHQPRVTDLEHKSGQGIDGVYEKTNPDGTKSYVIADAKVNSARLNKGLADGTDQMSDEWIDKRLDDSVGKEKADEIRDTYEDDPSHVSKEVYHFSYGDNEDGTSSADVSTVDKGGNLNKDKEVVQIFDKYGNEITGGEQDD